MEIARNCGAASKSMKKTLLHVATASESPLREKKLTKKVHGAPCATRVKLERLGRSRPECFKSSQEH